MSLPEQLRHKLAAKALQRQLERTSALAAEPFDARKVTQVERAALARFEDMPAHHQVRIMRQVATTLKVESPFFRVHEGSAGATTRIGEAEYLNFANYNYLGLSGDAIVTEAAKRALDRYGTSASASRMVAGERPVQRELERALANFYEVEDCVAFVSGHATNVTVIGALFSPGDLIVHDSLAHNSIVQGAQLSGAKRLSFPHNDWQALDALLTRVRGEYRRVLIAIEGLYSMDGDIPDLLRFVEIKRRHAAFLMVDEAHALGVLGAHGRGVREYCDVVPADVDIWMGTLSKTLAGCGGYIAGSTVLTDMLRHLAPGFLYSVGLAPVLAAGSLAALETLRLQPERVVRLQANGQRFLERSRDAGLDTGTSAGVSVVPVITGSSLKAAQWANTLYEEGINVQPIFYPAVEEAAARLRFFICSTHTDAQIDRAVDAVARLASSR